jgi:hypothetical protein
MGQAQSQVENTLNLMQASCINPNMSAYEAIRGSYNWNCFPLTPLGCKVVIYKSPDARGLWGSRLTNTWYLGPSVDHYQCNHYFVPKTRAYHPQHCLIPFLSTKDHLQELANKMVTTLGAMTPAKQQRVLTLVQRKLLDQVICPGGPAFLTNPCHAWILLEGNEQQVPNVALSTQPLPYT